MNDIDRRTVFVAGLAAASLISNANAEGEAAEHGRKHVRHDPFTQAYRRSGLRATCRPKRGSPVSGS
jgi:hypothetical protein